MPDHAVRFQSLAHFRQVNGAVKLMYLNGIASAECDVGASPPVEVGEIAFIAGLATFPWLVRGNLRAFVVPSVEREKCPADFVVSADQKLQRLRGGDGCGEVHGGIENARSLA